MLLQECIYCHQGNKNGFFNSIEFNGYRYFLISIPSPVPEGKPYLNFNVTIAITTHKMVTIQNRTAILLSWYPNFW
jgi:hypothetical protein